MPNQVNRRRLLAGGAAVALGGVSGAVGLGGASGAGGVAAAFGGAGLAARAEAAAPPGAGAEASLPPNFSFSDGDTVYLVPSGGGNAAQVASGAAHFWSPDGSRVFVNDGRGGFSSSRFEGGDAVKVDSFAGFGGVCSPDGRLMVYAFEDPNRRELYWQSTDGLRLEALPFDSLPGPRGNPHFNPITGVLAFDTFTADKPGGIYTARFDGRVWSQPELLIADGRKPRFSPDGVWIAYVMPVGGDVYQTWIAAADGTGGRMLSSSVMEFGAWSPDAQHIYYVSDGNTRINRIRVASGESEFVSAGNYPAFRTSRTAPQVARLWGGIALDTAIALSRSRWATLGQPADARSKARAVVLSRGDAFYDALAGSALAADKNAPLLITPPTGLYAPAEAEIKRILPTGGMVYVLGGTAAVPAAIENRLKDIGYQTKRLAGETMYETAIAINNEITADPDAVFVATGVEFYDALAAGAAAGSGALGKAVVVLTDGDRMPAASASYLDKLDPARVKIVLAGGPGGRALLDNAWRGGKLPSWPDMITVDDCVGETAVETALHIARVTFAAPQLVAIATSAGWYDALTGGAMIGSRGGPLLLTPPAGLHPAVEAYLSQNSPSLQTAYLLGGTAALPANLEAPVGGKIGIGPYKYNENLFDATASIPLRPNSIARRRTHSRR